MSAVALGAVMVDSHGADSTGESYVTINLVIVRIFHAHGKSLVQGYVWHSCTSNA